MVAHLGLVGRARLGRADVHAAVDLHRVDGDDLDVAEAAGDLQGDGRLAGRGTADQGQVRQPATTGIRVRWLGRAVTAQQLANQGNGGRPG